MALQRSLGLRPGNGRHLKRLLMDLEASEASATVLVRPGTYELEGSLRVSRKVTLWFARGASLKVAGELVVEGTIIAPPERIFDTRQEREGVTSGVRLVSTRGGRQSMAEVWPEWWGAGQPGDGGRGVAAMADSIRGAGRFRLRFGFHKDYGCLPSIFEPGHHFVAQTSDGAPCRILAIPGQGRSMLTILHGKEGMAPSTTFQRLVLVGAPGASGVEASPSRSLISLRNLSGDTLPVRMQDCRFEDADSFGMVLSPGVVLQARGLSASRCRGGMGALEIGSIEAGSLRLGPLRTPPVRTHLQWSNPPEHPPFEASLEMDLPDSQVVGQLTDVVVGGDVRWRANSESRLSVLNCQFNRRFEVDAPGSQLLATCSSFRAGVSSASNKRGVGLSGLSSVVMTGCTLVQPPSQAMGSLPILSGHQAGMEIDWRGEAGIHLLSGLSASEASRTVGEAPWLRVRGAAGSEARVVLSEAMLEGQGAGVELLDGGGLFVLEPGRLPELALRLGEVSRPMTVLLRGTPDQGAGRVEFPASLYPEGLLEVMLQQSWRSQVQDLQGQVSGLVGAARIYSARHIRMMSHDLENIAAGRRRRGGLVGDVISSDEFRLLLVCVVGDPHDGQWRRLLR